MEQVLKLVENYALQRVMYNHGSFLKNSAGFSLINMVIATLIILSICFILIGIYLWLDSFLLPSSAFIIFGGITFIFSIIIGMIAVTIHKFKKKKVKQFRNNIIDDIKETLQSLEQEILQIDTIQENPKIALLISSLIGFFIAKNIAQ